MTGSSEGQAGRPPQGHRWGAIGIPVALTALLVVVSFQNFLLFHALAELFAVGVAVLMTVVAWHTYPFSRNGFLMFLGCGFFWVGATDLFHMLIYRGMTVFDTASANPATQLWIAARFGQAALILAAPFFVRRPVPRWRLFLTFGGLFVLVCVLVIRGGFPGAFVDGQGLTAFKIYGEYVIVALLALALWNVYRHRTDIGGRTTQLMFLSVLLTIGSELTFTLYSSVYEIELVVGHVLKFLAFWLIFEAVIRDSLVEPYRLLEARVTQRTAELEQEVERRHRAERDIRRSEAWLRGVLDNSPDMITVKDRDCRYLLVNREFERFWGQHRDDVLGKTPEEVLSAGAAENARRQHSEVIRTGESARWEHKDPDRGGTPNDLLTVRFPILDAGGQVVAVGNVTTDVTEHKKADEQLRHSQKLKALGDLAGGIAHEINNLLVPVVTLSNVLIKRTPADDPKHKPLNLIHTAGLRARDIVAQVLAFSRQEQIDRSNVDIGAVLQAPLQLIHSTIPSSVDLKLAVPQKGGVVFADAGQLATVLINLISNSVDSLNQRTGQIEVSLTTVDVDEAEADVLGVPMAGHYARLRVTDTGCGMDGETVGRIFDPFFSTKEVGKGTGLGLSIVHGVVAAHKGVIDVASTPGAGSRFDVYIPMAETAAEPPKCGEAA